jgi:predicted secreted hydrolase
MYYSLTRLEATGTVQTGGDSFAVSGLSWMDHEFSTSALAPSQVGWDWFAIQLNNGTEVMLFHMRKSDGSIDPLSSGTLIAPDGQTTHLNQMQFTIRTQGTWTSPRSGATYPTGWHVEIPSAGVILDLEPLVADQELDVSSRYWEGAVRISGSQGNQAVSGYGYVELTGYTNSMAGQF